MQIFRNMQLVQQEQFSTEQWQLPKKVKKEKKENSCWWDIAISLLHPVITDQPWDIFLKAKSVIC